MAVATAQGRENTVQGFATPATHASLHTADPGTTGASELTGGSPAYARKPITWTPGAVDGVYTATVVFDVPTGVTLTHVGLWTALTAGTFLDKATVTLTTASQTTVTVNLTATAP